MAELAEAFSRASGRGMSYRQMPWDEFEQRAGHEMTLMYRWFEEKGYDGWVEQKWRRPAAQSA
ncbi:MAG TPA: hypothetical protein VH369_16875 [Bryobacteraceae bacterium]